MAPLCPHCGSKYVEKKRTTDSFSETRETYYCQSCKKEFTVTAQKNAAQGTWLMNVYSEYEKSSYSSMESELQIYRDGSGRFSFNQKERGRNLKTRKGRLKVYVSENKYIYNDNRFFVHIDSFQTNQDPEGTLFSIGRIQMSPEMKQKALQHEALRIAYNERRDEFCFKGLNSAMIANDQAAALRELLGAQDESTFNKVLNGCYVATAVYGSYDCPQVWTLRRFRDNTLAATWYGRAFIRTYYAVSPTLVKWFGHTGWFQKFWKGRLDKMVARLNAQGVEDTPYRDRNW